MTVYAARAGASRAEQYNAETGHLGAVSIMSDHPLDLAGAHGVHETIARRDDLPDTFRYECVRLLARLGDTLLVVPERYRTDPERQVVYTVHSASVELSFAAPAAMLADCD